jgi:opacity protein-like surface antigen
MKETPLPVVIRPFLRFPPVFQVFLFVLLLFPAFPAQVQGGGGGEREVSTAAPSFRKGTLSFQCLGGALFSPAPLVARTDVFDYGQVNLRLGRIFAGCDHCGGAVRGFVEGIAELTGSWIFKGFGSYLTGGTLLVRYNLLPAGSNFAPYAQAGLGVVYNDVNKNRSQTAIGQSFEFTPQCAVGVRYFIGSKWSVDGELSFQHISNARLSERNGGINAVGGLIGFTCFFDTPPE